MSLVIICLITVLPLSLMSTYQLFLLPIHYLSPTEWQWRPSGQLGNSYKLSSVSPITLATYFLYIVYLISIDLELSRLCNSLHCKAYSYKPGSHHLLTNQLPHSRSHYFYHLCSALSFFIHQTNGRLTLTDERTQLTNELTNQIKSSKRQNKVFAKTPIGPCLTCQNPKIITTSESKVNLILNQPSDWT